MVSILVFYFIYHLSKCIELGVSALHIDIDEDIACSFLISHCRLEYTICGHHITGICFLNSHIDLALCLLYKKVCVTISNIRYNVLSN